MTSLSRTLCIMFALLARPAVADADDRTLACMTRLKHWWNEILGAFYDGLAPVGWWHTANGVEILSNYGTITGDTKFAAEIADRRFHSEPDMLIRDDYSYDDQGWMALSWIQAHELTGEQRFLDLAVTWWRNILASAWTDSPCNGGLYWAGHGKTLHYKNAITNALFIRTSSKLFTATSNTTYLEWATKTWTWYNGSGIINPDNNIVVDGLGDGSCLPQGSSYTYNQGAIVGALAALYEAGGSKDSDLLDKALTLARVMISPGEILADFGESEGMCKTDCWQFKGIFMRNLIYLHRVQALPDDIITWVHTQADSIWANARDTTTNSFGLIWSGPFDKADPIRQMSALDAFLAAHAIGPSAAAVVV